MWVTFEECDKLASHLNVPLHRFIPAYTKSYSKVQGWRMLRSRGEDAVRVCMATSLQSSQTAGLMRPVQRCIFLDAESNLCTVHEQRPLQCSTYPWWPDLMDPAAWAGERTRICEGIEHEEAGPCDAESAGEQLRLATEHVGRRRAVPAV